MRIGPFGIWELLIILALVLLLFGAKRLPDMAKGIGQGIREFRKAVKDIGDDVNSTPAAAPAPAAEPSQAAATAQPGAASAAVPSASGSEQQNTGA